MAAPPPPAPAAAAAAAPAPAPVAPQHLFRVITQEIKATINRLRSSINGGNEQAVNREVNQAIQNLEQVNQIINIAIPLINDGVNNIHINRNEGSTTRQQDLGGIAEDIKPNAYNFLNNPTTTSLTNNDGVRIATLADGTTREINLPNLDNPFHLGDNGSIATHNALQPDYEAEYEITNENVDGIQKRLINCQYLEILYLTKHEELMKVFAFTLYLYDKYTYAIKILLFVLKNLLEPVAPPGCPEPDYPPGEAPKIRLPKALITNIKQLLKDQKQVQDVITRMKIAVNETVPNLVNTNMATAVATPPGGNLNILDSPPLIPPMAADSTGS